MEEAVKLSCPTGVRRLFAVLLSTALVALTGASPAAAQTTSAPAAPPSPSPATTTTTAPASSAAPAPAAPAPLVPDVFVDSSEESSGGGFHNIVHAENHTDNRFLLRGHVDLTHANGLNASPVNEAKAVASCTNCQTFAIALQIALIRKDATTIAPQNVAIALNVGCNNCFTSARAIQYVFQVADPNQVPDRDAQLVQAMNAELKAIQQTPGITVQQANARIDAVVAQFNDLAASLNDKRQETAAVNS